LRNDIDEKLRQCVEVRDKWRKTIERTKAKIDAAGLSETIGLLLRKQRRELPDADAYRREPRARQSAVRQVQYRRLDLHDERGDLSDIDDEVQATLAGVTWPVDEGQQQAVRFAAEEAFVEQRRLIDALITEYDSYFEALAELDAVQRQIADESLEYAGFIDERILWIRSTAPMQEENVARLRQSVAQWTDPDVWRSLWLAMKSDAWRHPLGYGATTILLFFWWAFHRRVRQRLTEVGQHVRNDPAVPLMRTVEAFVLTLFASLLWPVVLLTLSWRMGLSSAATESSRAVGEGLYLAACTLLFLEIPRQFTRRGGLAEAHFMWPTAAAEHWHAVLRSLLVVLVPIATIIGVAESMTGRARDDALGRLAFVLGMAAAAWFSWRLLRRGGRFMQSMAALAPASWFARLHRLWALPAVLLVGSLAAMAAAGYYYTALELTWRTQMTFALLFAL
ncbi:MAG: hypothetical protein KDA41_17720, partial [Planctomycetales bacterium]|nr:hypothetical protein [Planctomycetales bacterium]